MTKREQELNDAIEKFGQNNFLNLMVRLVDEGLSIIKEDLEIPNDIKEAADHCCAHLKEAMLEELK